MSRRKRFWIRTLEPAPNLPAGFRRYFDTRAAAERFTRPAPDRPAAVLDGESFFDPVTGLDEPFEATAEDERRWMLDRAWGRVRYAVAMTRAEFDAVASAALDSLDDGAEEWERMRVVQTAAIREGRADV